MLIWPPLLISEPPVVNKLTCSNPETPMLNFPMAPPAPPLPAPPLPPCPQTMVAPLSSVVERLRPPVVVAPPLLLPLLVEEN